jgi:hypothetical protein
MGDAPPALDALAELAADGAWTASQLAARRRAWGFPDLAGHVQRLPVRLRPTAWAHRRVPAVVVRPNASGAALLRAAGVRPQEIRPQELEHALGLAELRFRCGARRGGYDAQDALGRRHRRARARGGVGLGEAIADGAMRTPGGVVLLEYDHGRYTGAQVREKLRAQRALGRWDGAPVLGAIWGAPTERRAAWLRSHGVEHVVVLPADSWMAPALSSGR